MAAPALALAAGATALAPTAVAAPPPAMTVAVHPASGVASSYFTLSSGAGQLAHAGTLELRNRLGRSVTVRLDPVGALTASTLGSAYRVAMPAVSGQARWIQLPARRVVLTPHGRATIPVDVLPPSGTESGDYLSGISVEALGQAHESTRGNIAISSVQRYAVGLLVKVPGPRHSLIRFHGARMQREPAGLTFYAFARNEGNTILQEVRGYLWITRGRRTVARTTIGPGTFVTGTSIAYPLLAQREQPREGARYRVRGVMRYTGGIARLDTWVRFGHASAQRQEEFGGRAGEPRRGFGGSWMAIAGAAALVAAVLGLLFLLGRRRLGRPRRAIRELNRALARSRVTGEPLSLMRVIAGPGDSRPAKLAAALRGRVRRSDRLYRLSKCELLIVAPDTPYDAALVVAAELRRHLKRTTELDGLKVSVVEAGRRSADHLLERLRQPKPELSYDYVLNVDSFLVER